MIEIERATSEPATKYLSTFQASLVLGIHPSKLTRLYRAGTLPEPGRLNDRRVLTESDIEAVRRHLAASSSNKEHGR